VSRSENKMEPPMDADGRRLESSAKAGEIGRSQLANPTCFETRLLALLSMSGSSLLPQHFSARPEEARSAVSKGAAPLQQATRRHPQAFGDQAASRVEFRIGVHPRASAVSSPFSD
jgi:hypothetical protein